MQSDQHPKTRTNKLRLLAKRLKLDVRKLRDGDWIVREALGAVMLSTDALERRLAAVE